MRFRAKIEQWLLLKKEDARGREGWLAHRIFMGYMATAFVVGCVLARVPMMRGRQAAGVVLLTVFAAYLLERLSSIMWQWPLEHRAISRATLARHPLALWLLAFLLFGAAVLEPQPLYIIQDPHVSLIFRSLVVGAVMLNGLPFWIATCFLFSLLRSARELRGDKDTWFVNKKKNLGSLKTRLEEGANEIKETYAKIKRPRLETKETPPDSPPGEGLIR